MLWQEEPVANPSWETLNSNKCVVKPTCRMSWDTWPAAASSKSEPAEMIRERLLAQPTLSLADFSTSPAV